MYIIEACTQSSTILIGIETYDMHISIITKDGEKKRERN
jgi:hypothetical protein